MKVKVIPGPMLEQKKKQAQSYIQKRAIEIYLNKQVNKNNTPDPAA